MTEPPPSAAPPVTPAWLASLPVPALIRAMTGDVVAWNGLARVCLGLVRRDLDRTHLVRLGPADGGGRVPYLVVLAGLPWRRVTARSAPLLAREDPGHAPPREILVLEGETEAADGGSCRSPAEGPRLFFAHLLRREVRGQQQRNAALRVRLDLPREAPGRLADPDAARELLRALLDAAPGDPETPTRLEARLSGPTLLLRIVPGEGSPSTLTPGRPLLRALRPLLARLGGRLSVVRETRGGGSIRVSLPLTGADRPRAAR